jgi:O-antigen/teichoic acid export membrane protein
MLSLAVPFFVLLEIFIYSIRGFQAPEYKVYANDVFYPVLRVSLIVLLISLGYGIVGAAAGWVLSIVGASILAGYYLERKVFPIIKMNIKSPFIGRELFYFSWPLMIISVLWLVVAWTDIMMLGFFKTSADVGLYNAALPTAGMLGVILTAFNFLFMPVISELLAKKRMEELKFMFKSVCRWIFILTLPFFLLMVLFPGTVLRILFGSEYVVASLALSILALGFFISAFIGPTGQLILSLGRTKLNLIITAIAASSNFLLNLLLIPLYGIVGAAIAMTSSLIIGSVFGIIFAYSLVKVQPCSLNFLKPILAGFLAGSFLYTLFKVLFKTITLWYVLIGLFLFFFAYSFFLLILKTFRAEDLMIMRAIERRTGVRIKWLRNFIKGFI